MDQNTRSFKVWPVSIVGALLLFVGLMLWVAVIAAKSDPGRLESHPYERGLKHEAVLAARRALASHGWTATAEIVDLAAPASRVVRVTVRDSNGSLVTSLSGEFEALRPSDASADRRGVLKLTDEGRYEAEDSSLHPGLWLLEVTFDNSGERILLPQTQVLVPAR